MNFVTFNYNRELAVQYARRWAFSRNPRYYNFDDIGGDCTNFASQCLFAGSGVMNFTPVYGWFYIDVNDRTPSWTGVEYFRNFLVGNSSAGPFAREVPVEQVQVGDFVQLGNEETFYHTPVIVGIQGEVPAVENILVAAHTIDAFNRPLRSYTFLRARYLHIENVRAFAK